MYRKLAWSNTGSIAQIREDGEKIGLRTMYRDQKAGLWKLSDESKHPITASLGRNFAHIQCNGIGTDLAAVDDLGGVHLYSIAGANGRMQKAHEEASASDDHHHSLGAVVGLHWLPLYPAESRVSARVESACSLHEKAMC